MTLQELQLFVGYKTALVNSSGEFVDSMISTTELNTYINTRYKEFFWKLAEKYPESYEMEALTDITADEDTYPFGFGTSGDTQDLYTVRRVSVKYDTTDTEFTRARPRSRRQLVAQDGDTSSFVQTAPYYYVTAVKTSGDAHMQAIVLLPEPDTTVSNGLQIIYIENPPELSALTDTPINIPEVAHHLIGMATIPDVWEAKGDWTKSEKAYNRYLYAEKRFFDNYMPMAGDEVIGMIPSKSFNPTSRSY